MEAEGSLTRSLQLASGPYPQSAASHNVTSGSSKTFCTFQMVSPCQVLCTKLGIQFLSPPCVTHISLAPSDSIGNLAFRTFMPLQYSAPFNCYSEDLHVYRN
jgi:hypothetical protein